MKKKARDSIKELGIAIVYLFGSKAIGRESPLSDIDIGVVLRTVPPVDTRELYSRVFGVFSDLYPRGKLDITFLQNASLALQFSAIKSGKVLFEEDPRMTADYENLVVNQFLDFQPVLDFFDRVAAEKYAST
jgi:uncharacterized protein